MINRLDLHFLVNGLFAVSSVLEEASLVAHQHVANMIEQNEEDSQSENLPPQLTHVSRDPLCVLEVGDLDTQVKQVDEAASES